MNGFEFIPGNTSDLRKYIETLIYNEDLRKEMGRKSRLLVEEKLNWRNIAEQTITYYKSAMLNMNRQ